MEVQGALGGDHRCHEGVKHFVSNGLCVSKTPAMGRGVGGMEKQKVPSREVSFAKGNLLVALTNCVKHTSSVWKYKGRSEVATDVMKASASVYRTPSEGPCNASRQNVGVGRGVGTRMVLSREVSF